MPSQVFQRGEIIGEDYLVKRKIGEGQFSEVYEVEKASDGLRYAIKIEKSKDVRTVKSELKVLQRLQGCGPVCTLFGSGSEQGLDFFVMELLGRNLAETIQRDYGGCVPLTDVKVLATGLLNALEGFHREGFVHRDVKPANFALRDSKSLPIDCSWMLIDFGLARQYMDEKKQVLPPRKDAGFRGSTTYASLHAHDDKDLGRRDDLWSWFYMLVEMIEGTLPWRIDRSGGGGGGGAGGGGDTEATAGNGVHNAKGSVEERKRECISHPERLFSKTTPIPPVVKEINDYLAKLNFEDAPRYSHLRTLLAKLDAEHVEEAAEERNEKGVDNNHRNNNDGTKDSKSRPPSGTTTARAPIVIGSSRDRSRSLEDKKDNHRSNKERSRDRDRGKDRSYRDRSRSRSRARSRGRSRSRSRDDRGRRRRRSHSRSRTPDKRLHRRSRSRSHSRSRSPRGRNTKRRSGSDWKDSDEVVLVDARKKFRNTMEFIGMLRSGGISAEGAGVVRQLRMLQPTESLGIACLLIDELAAGLQGKQAKLLSHLLEDMAAFSQVTATRCSGDNAR